MSTYSDEDMKSMLRSWKPVDSSLPDSEPRVEAGSSCAPSESLGFHRKCEDRNHHWWPKADAVAVDIYDNGEVVVIVRVGERDIILECGGGSPNVRISDRDPKTL